MKYIVKKTPKLHKHQGKELTYWHPSFPWTCIQTYICMYINVQTQKIFKWLLILLLWCIFNSSSTEPARDVKCHRSI